MTNTEKYLKENRTQIVTILKKYVTEMSGVTLNQLMTAFKSKMEETNNNKTLSYFAAKQVPQTFGEIEVKYSKPYSESNHAKMVNYYGEEKSNQLMNI